MPSSQGFFPPLSLTGIPTADPCTRNRGHETLPPSKTTAHKRGPAHTAYPVPERPKATPAGTTVAPTQHPIIQAFLTQLQTSPMETGLKLLDLILELQEANEALTARCESYQHSLEALSGLTTTLSTPADIADTTQGGAQ